MVPHNLLIRGLTRRSFPALRRDLPIPAATNNVQIINRQAVIIALLAFYGLYFALYGVLGVRWYVYMVYAIAAYTAFICVLLAFGFIGMV